MRIIGCDLHARQQSVAMLDTETGEVVNRTLMHEGKEVREFYSQLPRPVLVGIEAIGPTQWFLNLLEELGTERQSGTPQRFLPRNPQQPTASESIRRRVSHVSASSSWLRIQIIGNRFSTAGSAKPGPSMDTDFAVMCPLVRYRMPQIQLLYIGSRFCSALSSDFTSR